MFITDHRKGKHQRVQAITVPGTRNIYSMVRPHGPVLESELVGYRLYVNEKQTPDIYGKFNKGLEINESQFYPTDVYKRQECYLRFGESLSDGVNRLLTNAFPHAKENIKPEFNIVYHFENEVTNRLIYLFIAARCV